MVHAQTRPSNGRNRQAPFTPGATLSKEHELLRQLQRIYYTLDKWADEGGTYAEEFRDTHESMTDALSRLQCVVFMQDEAHAAATATG
jgi:hypothetical protein